MIIKRKMNNNNNNERINNIEKKAVILTGSEQFCTHKGYAFSLVYGGPVVDTIPKYEGYNIY